MKRKLNYSKSHSDLKSHKARIQHYHEDKGKTPGILLFHSNTQLVLIKYLKLYKLILPIINKLTRQVVTILRATALSYHACILPYQRNQS